MLYRIKNSRLVRFVADGTLCGHELQAVWAQLKPGDLVAVGEYLDENLFTLPRPGCIFRTRHRLPEGPWRLERTKAHRVESVGRVYRVEERFYRFLPI